MLLRRQALTVQAPEISGRVGAVMDAATVTVLDAGRVQHRVRLQGIDAPDGRQPFANVQSSTCPGFRKDVVVKVDKINRYNRPVGVINLDGEDMNLRMVEKGPTCITSKPT